MEPQKTPDPTMGWIQGIAAIFLVLGLILGMFYFIIPGQWRVGNEVERAIKECLPKIETFMEKNQALLDEAITVWEASEFRLEVEFPTNQLYYAVPPENCRETVDHTSLIPKELLQIFDQLEGDRETRVTIALEPDGISLGWGFRTYVEIMVFHSEGRKDSLYHEGEPGNYDLGGGWYVCFLGVLRG